MIKNYIKIAWRSLRKRPLYACINILGLFAGIAFVLLIGSYVWQEYHVNRTIKNQNNQYLLTSKWTDQNMGPDFVTLGPPAAILKETYPHLVANFYRWDGITSVVISENEKLREGIQIGDDSFLDQFDFELLYGDKKSVFKDPFSVLITKEKAIKYFGTTDLQENSITYINEEYNGFFIAKNSSQFFDRADFENWELPFFLSFVELQPGVTPNDLKQPLQDILSAHASKNFQENLTESHERNWHS